MVCLDELKLHIRYDPDTGDCYRIGVRDCHGNLTACNYLIVGKTSKGRYAYPRVSINGRRYLVHRLAWFYMTGEWPNTVDHEDGNCGNNRWDNLRATNRHGNMRNLKLRKDNPTGYVGVAVRPDGMYYAHAQRDGERLFAGYFKTIEEAIDARSKMSVEYDFHTNHGSVR